jgi:hypothetical protein
LLEHVKSWVKWASQHVHTTSVHDHCTMRFGAFDVATFQSVLASASALSAQHLIAFLDCIIYWILYSTVPVSAEGKENPVLYCRFSFWILGHRSGFVTSLGDRLGGRRNASLPFIVGEAHGSERLQSSFVESSSSRTRASEGVRGSGQPRHVVVVAITIGDGITWAGSSIAVAAGVVEGARG